MTATAILPLTTVFSPPAACATDTWFLEYLSSTYLYDTIIDATSAEWCLSQGPEEWSSCFPSGYSPSTNFYYSPGVCPSGYSIASQSVYSLNDNAETHATCCPSGYSAQTEDDKVWYTTNRCTSFNSDIDHEWVLTKAGTVSTMTSADGINARAVFIRWQSTDFTTSTATSTESSSSTASTASNTNFTPTNTGVSSAVSPTSTSHANNSTSGQSSKAWIAGPVIGGVIACTLMVFAAIWCARRKYKISPNKRVFRPKGELQGDMPSVSEAPTHTWFPSKRPIPELSATNIVSELP